MCCVCVYIMKRNHLLHEYHHVWLQRNISQLICLSLKQERVASGYCEGLWVVLLLTLEREPDLECRVQSQGRAS
jgi:hypothetical protein